MYRRSTTLATAAPSTGALVLAALMALGVASLASASSPTCADMMGIATHGQHIVGDYVTNLGHDAIDWPPAGSVGSVVAGHGAAMPGAPGIHQHGGGYAQPGASFCNPQAQSPTGAEIPRGRP